MARAPLEHRAVAAGGRADRRHAARSCRSTIAASSTRTNTQRLLSDAHEDRRGRPRLERARHDQSGQGDDRAGARARAPWCWSTARRRRRTWRSTCRTSTATSTCCRATRCSARPASACSTGGTRLLEAMPPYQGGGDMIASVTFEKTLYNQVPYKFEAGHAEHRRRGGLRRGDRLPDGDRSRGRARARRRRARLRDRAASRAIPGRAHHRRSARRRPACCRSCSTACIRTTPARSSISRASPCAPASTARSR